MKTVTDKFVSAQKAPDATFVRQVYYKRRYWNPTTRAYVWEGSWTQLTEDRIQSVSPIQWQLDTDQLNQFKVSNVTLVVDNSDNRWRLDSKDGFFKQDTVSPVYGYEPYWTKFQIKTGFVLADGTTEAVAIFTGLATEYTMDSQSKACQISVDGLEALLTNAKAESICTTVTLENMGTGNGSNKDFTSLNPGVSAFTLVSKAGITQVEGQHYTVSQLNDSTLGGKISFVVAPDVGNVILATYIYWPQSKKFEELVALLLTAGGISSGNQSISPVNFSNSVLNTQTYTNQADWDTGTKVALSSSDTPGSLLVDFLDALFKTDQTWSQSTSGWTFFPNGTDWSSDGTYLISTDSSGESARRALTKGVGQWKCNYKFNTVGGATIQNIYIGFMVSTFDSVSGLITGGYAIRVHSNGGSGAGSGIYLLKADYYNTDPSNHAYLGYYPMTITTTERTVTVTRSRAGVIKVYLDGTLIITVTDASVSTGTLFVLQSNSASVYTSKWRLISTPASDLEVSWTSPTIDMTAIPSSWGQYDVDKDNNGETITVESRTSTDGISWDAWTARTGSNLPGSTLKRYAQTRFRSTIDTDAVGTGDLIVRSLDFRWTTASTLVTLPNFTGSSIYEALAKIGEFTNYEFGFNPDETFFFRPKTSSGSVMDLNQSDYLSQITGMDSGYSRVYGIVRATYGSIIKEITDDGAFASSPLARVTNKRFEISPDSNIQIPTTADIATGVASSFYSYLSKKRRRLKARAKFIPQIDLSDVVTLDLINNSPDAGQYFWGDPSIYRGKLGVHFQGADQQIVKGFIGKVIAARYDTTGRNCEFELEEVV